MISPHGGNRQAAQARYGIEAGRFLDFSANINPYGPPPAVLERLAQSLGEVRHYPDPACGLLREAVGAHLGLSPDLIMAGNGAAELIYLLARFFAWRRALVILPTFSEYAAAVTAAGGEVRTLTARAEDGFIPTPAAVGAAMAGCDVVFWCQPNNPTGCLLAPEALADLVETAARRGARVVVDEAFLDFVAGGDRYSARHLLPSYPNLTVLYSLTKILAIPGLRLGTLLAAPDLVRRLSAARDPWSVNSMAQVAGVAGLQDRTFLRESVARLERDRKRLHRDLGGLPGVHPFPSAANFLLLDVGATGYGSDGLVDALGRRGILVRDCANFPGLEGEHVRVAVRTETDNARLVEVLAAVLANGSAVPVR